jgi:xanthosine utilization system XapX-like protein
MPASRTSRIAVGMAASFTGLACTVIFLLITRTVSAPMGILMLVALVGLHLGFGILIAVYRVVDKLE